MSNLNTATPVNIVVDVFEGRIRSAKTNCDNVPINLSIREALRDRDPVYRKQEIEIDKAGVQEVANAMRTITINTVPIGNYAWGVMKFKEYEKTTFYRDGADLVVIGRYPAAMQKADDVQRVPSDGGFFTNPGNIIRCKLDDAGITLWVATQGYELSKAVDVKHGTRMVLRKNQTLVTHKTEPVQNVHGALTNKEINVLNSVRAVSDRFIFTSTFIHRAKSRAMLNGRQIAGVLGSLTKKGCIAPDRMANRDGFYVTAHGMEYLEMMHPRLKYAA